MYNRRMFKVFLVDDDRLILDELIQTVPWPENGFEVSGSASNPQQAFDEIIKACPDVVFCDLKMPGMDGNELIRRLQEAGVEAEYVMLSAYDAYEDVRKFYKQTGFDYILKPVDQEDMQMVLEGLSVKLLSKNPPEDLEVQTENPAFNQLVSYINDHFSEKITLSQLSDQFGFSRNYICTLFQKHFNKSLNLYLTDLRMAEAKKLLLDKTILIKEAAIRSGYTDYYHFFKVFKNYYGISPKEMRESIQ